MAHHYKLRGARTELSNNDENWVRGVGQNLAPEPTYYPTSTAVNLQTAGACEHKMQDSGAQATRKSDIDNAAEKALLKDETNNIDRKLRQQTCRPTTGL